MFDQAEAYSGSLIQSDNGVTGGTVENSAPRLPQTAEEILDAARAEAAAILEAAHDEADEIRQAIIKDAEANSEDIILKNAISAANQLRLDLWSSKSAMAEIVKDALEAMLGPEKNNENTLRAIDHAIAQYSDSHNLTISVSRKTADRLNLIAVGSGRTLQQRGINLVIDASIADDRTILETGAGKVEIGLKSQLEAFKQIFNDTARTYATEAKREVSRFGKVA